jgi:hypothetical protein
MTQRSREMTMSTKKTATAAALLTAALLLTACSGRSGSAADQPPTGEPTLSTPADETPTPTPTPVSGDFAAAVKFTKLAHQSKYKEANGLVLPSRQRRGTSRISRSS